MAPAEKKRKIVPTNDSFVRSKNALDKESRPSKRARPDHDGGGDRKSHSRPTTTTLSQLRDEDIAFPRGGASVLTPLEHKQIQIEATRDVLFEQSAKDKAQEGGTAAARKKTKSKGKTTKSKTQTEEEEDSLKIEGLSYRVFAFFILQLPRLT